MAEKPEVNTKKKKLTAEAEKSTEKEEPKLKRARKEEEPSNELVEVLNLPQAAVMKYVKEVLSNTEGGKNLTFSEDSQLVFQKAATVFVSYLSHFANDVAKQEGKTTVKESHVIEALETMGMAQFKQKLPYTEEKPKQKEVKEKPEKKEKKDKSEKSEKSEKPKEKKQNLKKEKAGKKEKPSVSGETGESKKEDVSMDVESPSVSTKTSPKAAKPKPEDYIVEEANLPPILYDWSPAVNEKVIVFVENRSLWIKGFVHKIRSDGNYVIYLDDKKGDTLPFDPTKWRKL
jgi:histone H3/H4